MIPGNGEGLSAIIGYYSFHPVPFQPQLNHIRLGQVKEEDVVDGVVFRQPKAYPVYTGEYEAYLEQIKRFLGSLENLQTAGRNGLHKYNNQDHSMLTAMLAVQKHYGPKA